MKTAPIAPDELLRLDALRRMNLLETPLEERFERVTRIAQRVLNTPLAAISLVDAKRQWFKSIHGAALVETPRDIAFCSHAILEEDGLVIKDARADERFWDNPLVLGGPRVVFYAGCPVRATDGSAIGTLCVMDRETREFSAEDLQTLRDLAAITESELNESMQESVQHELIEQLDEAQRANQIDALTRLWNRESIFDLLEAELARAKRSGTGMGVVMADLDYFKQVNDTQGHIAGDEVLRQAAKRMVGAVRETDALGRYGGEEFLVVLSGCGSPEDARAVAERIRMRISQRPFFTEFGAISASMSLGAAYGKQAEGLTAEKLVQAADDAMYRAKRGGRDKVELAEVGDDGKTEG